MADEKKTVVDAKPAETPVKATEAKAVKKVTKKVTKKAAKKVTKKVTKKVAKKATKKVAKKAEAKAASKVTKKVQKKAKAVKKAAKVETSSVENRIEQLQTIFKSNLDGLNERGEKAEALAKNIWLAGLGAYSRAYEEMSDRYEDVQDKVEEINEEGQKVFTDLVKRGQDIQGEIEGKVSKRKETLEDRVEEFRSRFGGGLSSFVDIPERLREAAEKVEEISNKLRGKTK